MRVQEYFKRVHPSFECVDTLVYRPSDFGPLPTSNMIPNGPRKRQKITRACDVCKQQKKRCTGTQPCQTCVQNGKTCTYLAAYSRGRASTPPQATVSVNLPPCRPGMSTESLSDLSELPSIHVSTGSTSYAFDETLTVAFAWLEDWLGFEEIAHANTLALSYLWRHKSY